MAWKIGSQRYYCDQKIHVELVTRYHDEINPAPEQMHVRVSICDGRSCVEKMKDCGFESLGQIPEEAIAIVKDFKRTGSVQDKVLQKREDGSWK